MSKARRARLRALLEAVEPRVMIRIKLRDMSPKASGAPVVARKDLPTPLGEVAADDASATRPNCGRGGL